MKNLTKIFKILDLDEYNGLYYLKENKWHGLFSNRVQRILKEKLKPDSIFCIDNKPFILFYENPKPEIKEFLFKAIWNFNESPIVIFAENNQIEIYNGYIFEKDNKSLSKIGNSERLNDFKYFELVTGKTWEKYQNELKKENRVDHYLLLNIKSAIEELKKLDLNQNLANSLIGKTIFSRYLIDREVKLKFETQESEILTPERYNKIFEDKDKANNFFIYLENQFNGNLFQIEPEEYKKFTQNCYDIISRLLKGEKITSGQMSLFDVYDFSILPIELISNVYETFIGHENQQEKGAYYTPLFLVDYILKETVEKYFNNNINNYSCKVLDPACGSGIFLVEALRKIIERYNIISEVHPNNSKEYKETLIKLVQNNIFGIDKEKDAIDVAIFSIYLTLLDYQKPPEIETFKFPKLLNTNFFINDFFDLGAEYNKKLEKIKFDFIIGNPPWGRGKVKESYTLYKNYIKKRREEEKEYNKKNILPEIFVNDNQIAQPFLLRVKDFSNEYTQNALIIPSKVLYNTSSINFRTYFLYNNTVNKILELSPVRREVFDRSNDPSVAPATIIFFNDAFRKNTDSNLIEHIVIRANRFFSLFKIFTITRSDYKKVSQKLLKDKDHLWKILVYGNYLDFNLIERLKNYKKISDLIYNKDFIVNQGFKRKDGNKKIDVSELLEWDFLDTKKKMLKQYYIKKTEEKLKNVIEGKYVGYIKKNEKGNILKDIYTAPALLITEGVNSNFEGKSAILYKNAVFTSSITSIKSKKADINFLRSICGFLNSEYFTYYILQTSSYIGIEREQTNDKDEKFSLPVIIPEKKVSNLVESIENEYKNLFSNDSIHIDDERNDKINSLKNELNELIIKIMNLDEIEKSLIDYAINVNIPIITKKENQYKKLISPIPDNDIDYLKDYASLFLNRFKHNINSNKEKFIVEISYSKYIIEMLFRIVPNTEEKEPYIKINNNNNNIDFLKSILQFSSEKITDRLFIQKDIRGFDKEYFYIIKPNEKRLWHKAIGYLDVNEFMDAILKAGRIGL